MNGNNTSSTSAYLQRDCVDNRKDDKKNSPPIRWVFLFVMAIADYQHNRDYYLYRNSATPSINR